MVIKDLQNIFFSYGHQKCLFAQISDLPILVDGNFIVSVSQAMTSESFWTLLSLIPLSWSFNRLYQLISDNRSIPFLTTYIIIILFRGTNIHPLNNSFCLLISVIATRGSSHPLPKSSKDSQFCFSGLQSPTGSAYPSSPYCHQVFRSPCSSSNQALSCLMKCPKAFAHALSSAWLTPCWHKQN